MAKRLMYNIVAINNKTGAKTYMTSSPVTTAEAREMMSRLTVHPLRHFEMERVTHNDAPERTSNPAKRGAPRKGTASPRRKSQITGKKPTVRLVRRRQANSKAGYFPNPAMTSAWAETGGVAYKYAIVQRAPGGDVTDVALVKSMADAKVMVGLLQQHAQAGVKFLVMKR